MDRVFDENSFEDFCETRNSRKCSRVLQNFREFLEFRKIKFL
jgi:hypothetical protein